MRRFNVTGICVPSKHYMVDISGKIAQIRKLVDSGDYFTVNRARQYGKTTTLYELRRHLSNEYLVIKISFEGLGDESFASSEKFCPTFIGQIVKALGVPAIRVEQEYIERWQSGIANIANFDMLSEHITNMCREKKIVLMIDEVDKTSNNRVFLHFLGMLRSKFLSSSAGDDYTFHSVILAGVYDVKNIKLKMMEEGSHTPAATEGKLYNSPWNIAVDFEVDMSFSPSEIATMLVEYEADHGTGMDIAEISEEIYSYTSGYPFLVSRLCKHTDEKLGRNWTADGVFEAVQILLDEANTLFDDLVKNLENHAELYNFIYDILILGEQMTFAKSNPTIGMGYMYGIIKKGNPYVCISNRIFELYIFEYFISKDETKNRRKVNGTLKRDIVSGGRFDMELCLRKFAEHYGEIFTDADAEFLERHGRLLFLSYLRPLINGDGFYHIESQFTDLRRMDIVVDFGREQFIVELKRWRGEEYERQAYEQLLGYMESKRAEEGYLLVFDFRREANKERKAEWLELGGKRIFEVVV